MKFLLYRIYTPHPPLRGTLSHKGRGDSYLVGDVFSFYKNVADTVWNSSPLVGELFLSYGWTSPLGGEGAPKGG